MSIEKFETPEFLKGINSDNIMKNMMANLPLDIDKTEGGFVWDMLKPTALEKAEILQFHLVRTLKMMFHMWAEGGDLDKHARANGLERKAANKSYGIITVQGYKGVTIPEGFIFSVPSDAGVAAIDFETLAEATIGDDEIVEIEVQAVEPGVESNVDADTITIMRSPMKQISNITNKQAMTGGTAAEDDDSLRQRIDDLLAGKGGSFVGNNADYVRWAEEIPGVGFAHTIPEYKGPNSVKIVVVDSNGEPANKKILESVYEHIWGTNRKDINRLAPVGVIDFEVVAPEPITIVYNFKLKLENGYTKEDVAERFKKAAAGYYANVVSDAEGAGSTLKFYRLAAILTNLAGVDDIDDFLVNGEEKNISFSEEEYPVTSQIEVTVYE